MDSSPVIDPTTPEPDMHDDLCSGRTANVQMLDGGYITGVVHRVYQRNDGTPILLVVGDTTIPWNAIRSIKAHVQAQTYVQPPQPAPVLGPEMVNIGGLGPVPVSR